MVAWGEKTMSIAVEWENDAKTILRFTYEGRWSWEDFYAKIGEGNEMIATVSHPVVSLVDMRKSSHIPPDAIEHIRRIIDISAQEQNTNVSVFVGAVLLQEMLIKTVNKSYPDVAANSMFRFTKTIEEGRALAEEIQASLKR
jgi:hypothetical protein